MLRPMKHGRGWEGAAPESDAGCGVRRANAAACTSVPRLSFFFFSQIRADSAQFALTQLQFAPNRADLARIKPYWLNRVLSAGDQNEPKSACRNSRNRL